MGWEDRPYYRDRSRSYMGPLSWLLSGSVPMFTAFGIRVRAHSSLIIFILFELILDYSNPKAFPLQTRAMAMTILVGIVILHEYGHCFAARWVGGSAEDIMLTPIGGLAYANTPHRPGPRFIMVAAGPAVNLAICLICAAGIYLLTPTAAMRAFGDHAGHLLPPLNPFHPWSDQLWFHDPAFYFWWVFVVSYQLLLFNLLPIFPLDGGQMLQAAIWPVTGHHRSMMIATFTGMVGSVLLAIFCLMSGSFLLLILPVLLFIYCYQQRQLLKESTPEAWSDSGTIDYSASIYGHTEKPKRRRGYRRAARRARKIALREAAERDRIDVILAKVSAHGMPSLTWSERRCLRKATERQKRRDVELSKLF